MRGNPTERRIGAWSSRILSLLVPPLCVVCEEKIDPQRRWVCEACAQALAAKAHPRRRLVDVGGEKLAVRYCLPYASVSAIMAEMKFADKPGLAAELVPFLSLALGEVPRRGTVLVPVPVHASKLRERGYNQSRLLAQGLARLRGLRVGDMLVKKRNTASQTNLERDRRLRNVAGSISVRTPVPLPIDRAILVDDVVTTGSTLRECALALRAGGIKEIAACAVAASS